MISLSWEQVNQWRLSRHHLLERANRKQLLGVVADICGAHAQVMSAAELSLCARIDGLASSDVENALWKNRTLIKTWAMRGTLHLMVAADWSLYAAGLAHSVSAFYRRPSWLKYHGVSKAELDAIIEGIRETLGSDGMTREELADAIATRMDNLHLGELLLSGWGALLKPAAHAGYLCFGPNQGQNVTFVRPDAWLGGWNPVEPETALAEITRRYLATYGPVTADDFGRWWGLDSSKAKKLIKKLGDEVAAVSVEGWEAWALASSLEEMNGLKPTRSVRLVPHFDPYVLAAYRHCQYILAEKHKAKVYRQQGWISPVVLVDGRMEGVWEQEKKRSEIIVTVAMFEPASAKVKEGIETEIARLGEFLGGEAKVVYANG